MTHGVRVRATDGTPVEPSPPPEPIRGKHILVVDDEPWIVDILTAILTAGGHEVDSAADGRQALATIQQHSYDLIVCDMRMPNLDGPGLYAALEGSHPALCRRILFVTGSAFEPETEQFLERTRAPYLLKPFTLDEVRHRTQALLREGAA